MAALGRAYFFCMGFRVVVKGTQVSSSEAPILAVAPHSTFFDGIVCIVAGLPSTVSRVENLATPIFGREMLCAFLSLGHHRRTACVCFFFPPSECVCSVWRVRFHHRARALSSASAGVQEGPRLQEEHDPGD